MEKKVPILFIILLIVILFFSSVEATPYSDLPLTQNQTLQYDGSDVYINTPDAYIRAPAEIHGSGWTYLNFTAKSYSGNIDLAIGFDTTHLKPKKAQLFSPHLVYTQQTRTIYNVTNYYVHDGTGELDVGEYNVRNDKYFVIEYSQPSYNYSECDQMFENCTPENYTTQTLITAFNSTSLVPQDFEVGGNYSITWYVERLENWVDITHKFSALPESIHNNYDNKDKWYYVTEQPINVGIEYQIRIFVDTILQFGPHVYKYDVVVKPSIHTFQKAIDDGTLYVLDPLWNVSYDIRLKMPINNTAGAGAQTYFQLNTNISAYDVNASSLRCYNRTSGVITPHWSESVNNGNVFELLINNSVIASGWDNNYYCAWQSTPTVSSSSSISDTSIFGDDFEDNDVSDWTNEAGASISIESGIVKSGTYSAKSDGLTNLAESYKTFPTQTNSFIIEFDARVNHGGTGDPSCINRHYYLIEKTGGDYTVGCVVEFKEDDISYYAAGNTPTVIKQYTANTWYKFKLIIYPTTDTWDIYIDDVLEVSGGTSDGDITPGLSAFSMMGYGLESGDYGYVDNIFLRKYNATPPVYENFILEHYSDSLHYNATQEVNNTIYSNPSEIALNRSAVVVDDTNWTANGSCNWVFTTAITPTGYTNFTTSGDNLDNFTTWNLTASTQYGLKNASGTVESQTTNADGNATFEVNLVAGDYWIESSGVTNTTPPTPITLTNITGNFYVNYSWQKGIGKLTDSWNVSQNGTWNNGTTQNWSNDDIARHGTSTIIIFAYNSTSDGNISSSSVTDAVTLSNNPITITNLSNQIVDEGDTVYVYADHTDLDGDSGVYTCNRTDLFSFDQSTGTGSWLTDTTDNATYYIDFGVADGYTSTDNFTMRIVVNDVPFTYIPADPYGLVNSTGNFWVTWDWDDGSGNVTDTFNMSINGTWYNNTVISEYNHSTISAHGTSTILLWAYNSSGSGTLSNNSITGTYTFVNTFKDVGGIYYFWGYENIPELYANLSNASVLSYDAGTDIYTFHDQFLQNDTSHTFYYNETVHFESLNDTNEANLKWLGEIIFDNATTIGWNTTSNTPAPIADATRAYMTSQVVGHGNISNSNFSYLGYNAALSRGLDLVTHTNLVLHNNTFYQNFYAVVLTTVENATITNNTAYDGRSGIVIDSATNSTISNNSAYSNDFDGFYFTDGFNNTIDNNTARNNDQDGFMIYDSQNNTFKNNTVYSNGWEAFHLYNASNNTLSNNNVSDAGGVYYDYKIWTDSINTIIIDTVKTGDYYYIDTSSHFLTFNNGVDYNITVTESTVIQDNTTIDVEAVNISVISGTVGQIGVTSLTATTAYQLQYSNGTHIEINTTNGAGTATFDSDLGVGNYRIVTPFAPIVTLLSQTPSEILQNSTGCMNISYGVSHDSSGLNNTSIAFIYRNYDYDMSDSNHSIRPPNNSIAADWNLDGRILRGANRNETLNFEGNDTITGGDDYTWSGLDYNSSGFTVVPVNGTYTKVYINKSLHCIMPQMWYLDRTDMQKANKTTIPINKNQDVLVKFWDYEIFKDNTDFLGVGYTDTVLDDNPSLWPSDAYPIKFYYINSSYDPVTGGDPLTSGFAFLMGSLNASGWVDHVYEPHANSSYVRGFINNTFIHQNMVTTEEAYILYTSETPPAKSFYINVTADASSTNIEFNQTNVMWAGNAAPYTQQLTTPNIWFAFMKANMAFEHKLYVADTLNKWGNSTLSSTVIEEALFPPTKPVFNTIHINGDDDYDMNGTYNGTIKVCIGVGSDPDGGVTTHNLSLHYGINNTYITTINNTFTDTDITHNGVYCDVSFDTSAHYSDIYNYTMRVIATDDEDNSVVTWLGVNFTLQILNLDNFTWTNEVLTPSVIPQYAYFTYSIDINDSDGNIIYANVSFNSINYSMTQGTGDTWSATIQGLLPTIYRIDGVYATDDAGSPNSTTSALTCDVLRAGGHGGGVPAPTPTPTPEPTPTITPVPTEIPEVPEIINISDIIERLISDDVMTFFRFNFDPNIRTYQKTMIVENSTRCEENVEIIKSCSVIDELLTVTIKFDPDKAFIFYHESDYVTVFENGFSQHIDVDIYVINFMASINLPENKINNPCTLFFSSDDGKIDGVRIWWLLLLVIIGGVIYYRRKKNDK